MDNATRSKRTRAAIIRAALGIIAREGAGHLTLDAIARECGISKGALTHQFRTKKEVLEALLEEQTEFFSNFSQSYLSEYGSTHAQPELAAQIATLREALRDQNSLVFALLGAIAEEPELLRKNRSEGRRVAEAIKKETTAPEMAMVRWMAARGLTISSLLGLCPLNDKERNGLFNFLLDDTQWPRLPSSGKRRSNAVGTREPAKG